MDPEGDRLISTDEQEREAQLHLRRLEFLRAARVPMKIPQGRYDELFELYGKPEEAARATGHA